MDNLSDEELVQRCQAELPHQTRAYEMLVHRYKQKVFGKVLGMIRNVDEARDVTQDVFVKVFHGLYSFRHDSKFSTWLYAITVNTSINHIEKLKRRPWWWLSEDFNDLSDERLNEARLFHTIGRSLEREELRKKIATILAGLSETYREVLKLRYFEELDYEAIALRLRIGMSAAKMRLKRAREEFRARYEQQSESETDD